MIYNNTEVFIIIQMTTINTDGVSFEVSPEIAPMIKQIIDSKQAEIDRLKQESKQQALDLSPTTEKVAVGNKVYDSMEVLASDFKSNIAASAELTSKNGELTGQNAVLKAEIEKQKKEFNDSLAFAVKERVALERTAKKLFPQENFEDSTNNDLKIKVIKSCFPSLVVDAYSEDQLNGAFSAAIASIPEDNNINVQRAALERNINDACSGNKPANWGKQSQDEEDLLGKAITENTNQIQDAWKWVQGGAK